jgi:hypothetical protein
MATEASRPASAEALESAERNSLAVTVELDGYAMHLRPSEMSAVAAGLGVDALALPAALRRVAALDRPPTWEIAIRHYGRRRAVAQAAGEIGMDVIHARDLLARLTTALDSSPIADS